MPDCRAWLVAAGLALPVAAAAAQAPAGRYAGPRGIILTLSAEGGYAFADGPRMIIAGVWREEGERLVLRDSAGAAACPDPGTYRVRRTADTLRFEADADACGGRRGALTAAPWVRLRAALVLRGATVIDGTGAPPRHGTTLVLRDGRIAAVHPDGAVPPPDDATVRDLDGAWVLPGLIDTHVHLATTPSEPRWRQRTERILANALRGGVVAVRDMGGDARALADLARVATTGKIVSPEIHYAAIVAGPQFFDDARVRASSAGVRIGSAPWARAVENTTDFRQVVAEARGAGARGLKLYGALDASRASRLAAEGRRQGLGVWAHLALYPARPSEVVESGVEVVSHALLLAVEAAESLSTAPRRGEVPDVGADHPAVQRVIALMRDRRVTFEPTLRVFRAAPSSPDTSEARRREARARAFTAAAHAAGVRIAAGTDGIGSDSAGALPSLHEELELLVAAGLAPMDALVAATSTAAMALGIGATHGTIAVGKAADLVVLAANPTADIRHTRRIVEVVRRGISVSR